MTARQTDLKARKNHILSITIEQYIDTVSPVSSNYIAQQYHHDLSSATIRNILAELEEEGLLTHPHTSAGRIPTQKGYRYYVDNLLKDIKLLEEEKHRIKIEYQQQTRELETLLERTSQILANITSYTSIISIDGSDERLFCTGLSSVIEYADIKNLQKIKSILVALEEKKRVLEVINRDLAQKIEVFIGEEMMCEDIEGCSLAISRYKTKRGPSGRIAILGPTRMNYEKVISALDYVSQLMEELF